MFVFIQVSGKHAGEMGVYFMSMFIVPMSSLPSISSLSNEGIQVAPTQGNGASFADFFESAVQDLAVAGAESQATMYDLALGGSDDLHNGAIAAVKSSTSINFTSSLISAAIGSYNELMRMQI